jgi:hypothetical protein
MHDIYALHHHALHARVRTGVVHRQKYLGDTQVDVLRVKQLAQGTEYVAAGSI